MKVVYLPQGAKFVPLVIVICGIFFSLFSVKQGQQCGNKKKSDGQGDKKE